MSLTPVPRKLQTVMKDVICPNCRYRFKTARVAVYPSGNLDQSSIQIQQSPTIHQISGVDRPKQLSLLLDLEMENSEFLLSGKQNDNKSSQIIDKIKSQISSRKQSLATPDPNKVSNHSKTSNQKSRRTPNADHMPSIKITSQIQSINIDSIGKQFQRKISQFLDKSIQCDSYSLNSESFSNSKQKYKQKNKQKSIQKSRSRQDHKQKSRDKSLQKSQFKPRQRKLSNKLTFDFNSPGKSPKSPLSNFQREFDNIRQVQTPVTYQMIKQHYQSGPSYYAIRLMEKQKNQFKQIIKQFMEYYKRQPIVCNLLPSYLKALMLEFKN